MAVGHRGHGPRGETPAPGRGLRHASPRQRPPPRAPASALLPGRHRRLRPAHPPREHPALLPLPAWDRPGPEGAPRRPRLPALPAARRRGAAERALPGAGGLPHFPLPARLPLPLPAQGPAAGLPQAASAHVVSARRGAVQGSGHAPGRRPRASTGQGTTPRPSPVASAAPSAGQNKAPNEAELALSLRRGEGQVRGAASPRRGHLSPPPTFSRGGPLLRAGHARPCCPVSCAPWDQDWQPQPPRVTWRHRARPAGYPPEQGACTWCAPKAPPLPAAGAELIQAPRAPGVSARDRWDGEGRSLGRRDPPGSYRVTGISG
ncbi:uncharacterized protein LOC142824314 [Pelodiscus sinensis]|uniref:uncharacterized protein LOC142824314 n=1 Tax=Pelodiscus sinensis TaxID=13735 RepID=UPI003F6CC940